MSSLPEARLHALPRALSGPDTHLNHMLGNLNAEMLRLRFEAADMPMAVSWTDINEPKQPLDLEAEEKRLVHAFAYLITTQKKSTLRLEKMQALYQKYQSEDLAEMLLTYTLTWHPEQAEHLGETYLVHHPDSLGLRLNLALLALSRSDSDKISELLDGQLQWPLFQALHPALASTAVNVRIFYTIVCLYHAHQQQLQEAVFCYAICRDTNANLQELLTLSRALERQITVSESWDELLDWLKP